MPPVLAFRIATQTDVPLLASMNERLIRDEGHRSTLTQQSLEPRMSRWLAGDYRAAIFSQIDPLTTLIFDNKPCRSRQRPYSQAVWELRSECTVPASWCRGFDRDCHSSNLQAPSSTLAFGPVRP